MTKPRTVTCPRRGEVYLVNFDPTIGSEIKKTRPALILQNNIGNDHAAVTIVAAITSAGTQKVYPTQVAVECGEGGLEKPSLVLLNQIRTIDKQRLSKRLGMLSDVTMHRVDTALAVSVGLVDL